MMDTNKKNYFTNTFSEEIWKTTYKDFNDNTIEDTWRRVAKSVASVEKDENLKKEWEEKFYEMMVDFKIVPGGRVMSNAGTSWKGTTLINCFDENSCVFTDKGYKKIKDIIIGERVLTHTGNFKKVINVINRKYNGIAYKLSSKNFTEDFIATPEHPFYQSLNKWETIENTNKIVLMKNLEEREEFILDLASFFNDEILSGKIVVDNDKIYTKTLFLGGNGAKGLKLGEKVNRYIKIDSKFLYFIGRFVGDGSTFSVNDSKFNKDGFNIVFSNKEMESAMDIKSTMEEKFGLKININKNKTFFYLRKNSIIVSNFLERICGSNVYSKQIPPFVYTLKKELKLSFLQGIIDSDGYFSKDLSLVIAMMNAVLINNLQALFLSVGIPMIKGIQKTKYRGETLIVPKITSYNKYLLCEFYKNSQKIYEDKRLTKKIDINKSIISTKYNFNDGNLELYENDQFTKTKIEFNGMVYNLSVEDDESYVVNNAVVHNCYTGGRPKYDCDSIEGILQVLKEQCQTLKSEGGWGLNFSFIRPRGTMIKGIGVETPGAIKYMEMFDKSSDIITAGSGRESSVKNKKNKIRKGAQMSILDCWHPDVVEHVTAKQQEGRLTKFNMSVNCSNEFMDTVIKAKNTGKVIMWDLIFPDTTFSKYKEEWDGDIEKWKTKNYPVIIHKSIDILELWDLITRSTYAKNEPGVLFLDRANETYLYNYSGLKIRETNACCVVGETKIMTDRGWKTIEDIYKGLQIGEKYLAMSYNIEKNKYELKEILHSWQSRNDKTITITIEGDKQVKYLIECSLDHCIYTTNRGYVPAEKLSRFDDIEIYGSIIKGKVFKTGLNDIVKPLYDIEVKDNHNFIVNDGILIKNSEQTMPEYSSCNLLSINLTQYYDEKTKSIDYNKLEKYARYSLRFSDNINDLTYAPLPQYKNNIINLRRVGIGIFGWASLLYMLKTKFSSKKAGEVKDKIMETICYSIIDESTNLAKEKGMFVGCDPIKQVSVNYFNKINLPKNIKDKVKQYGLRNSSLFSIQPTGNTAVYANIISGGLEPIFLHDYIRTVIVQNCPDEFVKDCPKYWEGEFKETGLFKWVSEGDEKILRGEYNGVVYKIDKNRGLTKEVICSDYGVNYLKKNNEWNPKAEWAVTTNDLTVEEHLNEMIGFCKWLDASCSKSINLSNKYSFEKFQNVYLDAYRTGVIKGVTTYRAGTMTSVLSAINESEINTEKIQKAKSPKRPTCLSSEIYHFIMNKQRYYVAVGLLNNELYEVFTGINSNDDGDIVIPKDIKLGKIRKESGGKYILINNDGKEYQLTNGHSDDTADALTRLISTALRFGTDISVIVKQLEKTKGHMFSFSKILARTLKKYIKNGTLVGDKCPDCSAELIRQEGCVTCPSCSYSKCG